MSGARFIDREQILRELGVLAARARREHPEILRVVLFGSLAKNTYTAASDADLLIVLKRSDERLIDRIPRFLRLFVAASIPVEVFPYTDAETRSVPLARKALQEGHILA
jgi:predicted nucleotidyltransferase